MTIVQDCIATGFKHTAGSKVAFAYALCEIGLGSQRITTPYQTVENHPCNPIGSNFQDESLNDNNNIQAIQLWSYLAMRRDNGLWRWSYG